MTIDTDRLRRALEQFAERLHEDDPSAIKTAAAAQRARKRLMHGSQDPETRYGLVPELLENPGQFGPTEIRRLLVMLDPRPDDPAARLAAFQVLVETLTAVAFVERSSLGAYGARRLRANVSLKQGSAAWKRWYERRKPTSAEAAEANDLTSNDSSEPEYMPIRQLMDAAAQQISHLLEAVEDNEVAGSMERDQTQDAQDSRHPRAASRATSESPAVRPRAPSFWSSLTEDEQRAFAALAQRRSFNAGSVLCREGEAANDVMVIQSGWTKVCVDVAGSERILAVRGVGDLLGERAVLRVRSRSATVVALDPVTVFLMPAEEFGAFLDEHPRVLAVLERQVYDRLTEERQWPQAQPIDVEQQQLASLILDLVLQHGVGSGSAAVLTPPISYRDLASWTRLPDETVTLILSSWHAQGLVLASRQRITAINVGGLERIFGKQLGQAPGEAKPPPALVGQNCSILLVDITSFGSHRRDDVDRQTMRRRMYEIIRDGFEVSGVPWGACRHEDRGDGVLIVAPPSVPTVSLVDPLLEHVAAALRRHNRRTSKAVRMQLRLALHVGPVVSDPEGVSGTSIIQTARLLESPVLKDQVIATDADLGFIVSTFVYDTVVKHGPGYVDPAGFQQINFRTKELETTAWMYLARSTHAGPPMPEVSGAYKPPALLDRVASFGAGSIVGGDFVIGSKDKSSQGSPSEPD